MTINKSQWVLRNNVLLSLDILFFKPLWDGKNG